VSRALLAAAAQRPLGLSVTLKTLPAVSIVLRQRPVCRSHRRSAASSPPDSASVPSWFTARLETRRACPASVRRRRALATSHRRRLRSSPPESTQRPSGPTHTLETND